MNRGIFRLSLLLIAGTTRAWYLYLVSALLGAVILVSAWMGRRTGDLEDAIAIAAICSAVMWLIATVGILATVQQLRDLRPPHVYRKAGLVLGLVTLFTLIIPTALLVLSGDAAFQLGTTRHIFMTLALGAATGMLIATLPLPIVGISMIFGPPVLNAFPIFAARLTQSAFWQSPWHVEALTALALCIVAWRCRTLILTDKKGGASWSSLAQMRVTIPSLFLAAGHDPNAAYRMFPAWMVPSWRTRADASLWARISTLMGPPFAPGNLRQLLLVLAVVGVIGAPFMWIFVQRLLAERLPEPVQRMFLDTMVSLIPAACITFLAPMAKVFATRLRMIHRPQSADLAEFALLPGLGVNKTPLANYCLVIFGRPLRILIVLTAILGGAVMLLAHLAPWNLLLLMLIVAGITVMEIARYLAAGRPYVQNLIVEGLVYVAVVFSMAALAFFSAHTPFVSVNTSHVISHVVMPAIIVIVWLAAIHGVRRAYASAEQLPHPFLDADERRVLTLS